jgi:hypothetical protein
VSAGTAVVGPVGLVLLVVVLSALAIGVAVAVRAAARTRSPAEGEGTSAPDLVPGLMAELRKWQAEAAYWKATAERLQRELDQRDGR